MKKKIFSILFIASLFVVGCAEVEPEEQHTPGIYITLKTPAAVTKAEWDGEPKDGIDELNENRLMTIDFYLYCKDDLVNPKASGHLDVEEEVEKRFKVDLTGTSFDAVFGGAVTGGNTKYNDAVLFAIANLPAGTELPETLSIENLLNVVVHSPEFTTEKRIMDAFVMAGQSTVEKKTNTYASGFIEVQRTAAKFSVNATMASVLEDEKTKTYWTPDPTSFRAQFFFGNQFGALGGDQDRVDEYVAGLSPKQDAFYVSEDRPVELVDETNHIYSPIPFYTYPRAWDYGDVDEPYLFLTLNMKQCTEAGAVLPNAESVPCYYKVLLSAKSFEMNHWYDISLQIKMLGSWTKVTPTVLTTDLHYYVVDWNGYSGEAVPGTEASVEGVRFLQLNEQHYDAYNVEELLIPFSSSHHCTVVSATGTHEKGSSFTPTTVTNAASYFDIITVDGVEVLQFNHPLNITMGSNLDTTPYTFTVTIRHDTGDSGEDEKYEETITVMQYPPIVVSREVNTSMGTSWDAGSRGDVYVNGQKRYLIGNRPSGSGGDDWSYYTTDDDYPRYNTVRTRSVSDDGEQVMYIVETKILPDATGYSNLIITDSRCSTANKIVYPEGYESATSSYDPSNPHNIFNEDNAVDYDQGLDPGLAVGPALYDGATDRKMKYYYGAATSPESENYISPKFRIASNFSSAGNMDKKATYVDYMAFVRRCATYQEAGYPAGRWRVPTYAEIKYVCDLQKNSLLPKIFYNNPYVCSTAIVQVSSSYNLSKVSGFTTKPSIRCVYDDWYWENTDGMVTNTTYQTTGGRLPADDPSAANKTYGTFVWGDMPR